jgi:dolichyl-phosphate-mannose--protein O-mannosyl transferase
MFVAVHVLLLIGLATPQKFVFDEVHYVPAARQMLAPAKTSPMLNPMHPPLAKELMALSIRTFGDNAFGWRYPGTLFGALAVVAIYLCGLALFKAQGPAIAAAVLALLNQMLAVAARIATLDVFALGFGLLAIAASCMAIGGSALTRCSRSQGSASAWPPHANGAGCFPGQPPLLSSASSGCCSIGRPRLPIRQRTIGIAPSSGRS